MNATAQNGVWEEPVSENIKLIADTRTNIITVHINGKEPVKYDIGHDITPADITKVKEHVKSNYLTIENFREVEINEFTILAYSPEINLLKLQHKGGEIIIPGANYVIDFLNETREEHRRFGYQYSKISDAHE